MKAIWSGSISFGLVAIPIKLFSAVEPSVVGFKLLCGKCQTPLRYKRYCPKCEKEVAWENVVKGLKVSKDVFYVLKKEEIEELRPEKTPTIEILQFVDMHSIDPIYYDKHYYVAPAQEKEKAYFLFKEVLQATAKTAIGKFVMREKEYVCAIEAYKNGLLLTTLNYAYEIRDINQIEILKEKPKLKSEEFKLAKELIKKFYQKEFSIAEFKDTFADKLKEVVKKKLKGEKIEIKKEKPKKKKETLMKMLELSVKAKK